MSDPPAGKPDRLALDELASRHVARLLSGASPEERRRIGDWIDADPHHAVAFARMQGAWEASARLHANPPDFELPADREMKTLAVRRGVFGGLIAACVFGGGGTAALLLAPHTQVYRTRIGERRTAKLADGSSVELNTASAIKVAMRRSRREVRLVRGEAHFQVAHDPGRPFFVEAGTARFRAVGTAFNVRLRDKDVVELTVTEGVVAVASARALHLGVGQGAVIEGGAVAPLQLGEEALRQRTAWQQGVIELHGETLAQVVDEFNRYQARPIVISDPDLAGIRIGGRFQVDEADKFLAAISSSFPIDVIRTSDGVLLTPRRGTISDPA